MEAELEKEFNDLYEQERHKDIVEFIEQIPEGERDWPMIGWYIRSLNNSEEYLRAEEVSMRYQAQGESDPMWHYRLGYALWYLDRDKEADAAMHRAKELAQGDEKVLAWVEEFLEMIDSFKREAERRARISRNPTVPPLIHS